MIIEIALESGLIRRESDQDVYIRNEQTGGEYAYAEDLPNHIRQKRGLALFSYVETNKPLPEEYILQRQMEKYFSNLLTKQ